jgi:surface carbohydrate biosynthesis protein
MIINIPIEVKDRELYSKLLICYHLLKSKKKIKIVLTKSNIFLDDKIKKKNIVYFEKSLSSHKQIPQKKLLKENFIINLDEEGPFYHWPIAFKKNRINSEIINKKNFKYFFLWGSNEKFFFKKNLLKKNKHKIIISGHPKFDYLKKKNHQFFSKEIKFIEKNFQNIILVSSSFFYDTVIDEELYKIYIRDTIKDKKGVEQFFKNFKYDFENYIRLINLTKKIAKKFSDYTIIFRPHPRQDINKVKNRFGKIPENLKIIYKFTSSPWIIKSNLYIHSHCATVYEALLLKKKIFCFRPNLKMMYEKKLTEFGEFHQDEDKLIESLNKQINNKIFKNSVFNSKVIYFNEKGLDSSKIIAHKIIQEFGKVKSELKYNEISEKKKNYTKYFVFTILSILKGFLYNNFKNFYLCLFKYSLIKSKYIFTKDYKNNKIKSLQKKEIVNFFKKIGNSNMKINCKKINEKIFEIYRL